MRIATGKFRLAITVTLTTNINHSMSVCHMTQLNVLSEYTEWYTRSKASGEAG